MDIEFKSYSPEVEAMLEAGMIKGMTACGMKAEGYAKDALTDQHAIDTGLLRNSVTYAVSGQAPHIISYKADKVAKGGTYSGTMPEEENGVAMYVGTNVEYAPYIEYGTGNKSSLGGGTDKKSWVYKDSQGSTHHAKPMAARPFLKPAIANHLSEYEQILTDYIKEALT